MAAKRILLVEDEEDIAEILALVLRSEGYIVDTADTLAQARQRLKSMRYTLVNTDLRLPDGDGLEIVDRAAELGARTSILSGYVLQFAGTRCGPARGADEANAPERIRCRRSSSYRPAARSVEKARQRLC
jgi:CheY-like chemotaxis protein